MIAFLALRDFFKNIKTVIVFTIEIVIISLFIMIVSYTYTGQENMSRVAANLKNEQVTAFGGYSGAEKDIPRDLLRKILNDASISSITGPIDSNIAQEGIRVFFAIGSFGDLNKLNAPGKALIGSDVKGLEAGDWVHVGTDGQINHSFQVAGKLKKDRHILHGPRPGSANDLVIIFVSPEKYEEILYADKTRPFAARWLNETLLRTMIVLGQDQKYTDDLASEINSGGGYQIIPYDLNSRFKNIYKSANDQTILLAVIALCTIIFLLVQISSNLNKIIRKNLNENTVHFIYGATKGDIAFRLLLYTLLVLLPGFTISFLIFKKLADLGPDFPGLLILSIAGVVLLLVVLAVIQKFKTKNIIQITRDQ